LSFLSCITYTWLPLFKKFFFTDNISINYLIHSLVCIRLYIICSLRKRQIFVTKKEFIKLLRNCSSVEELFFIFKLLNNHFTHFRIYNNRPHTTSTYWCDDSRVQFYSIWRLWFGNNVDIVQYPLRDTLKCGILNTAMFCALRYIAACRLMYKPSVS
jgi:hypothetical protein